MAGARAWSVRRKVTVYVVAQMVAVGGLLAVCLGADLDVPVPFVVAGCVGPAVGGLVGLLNATKGRSGSGGPGD
ncbi:hypothetical protein [Streptomyces sp. NBC_00102]|uniref:hypothetical protein n=1 Tax=Streptomyces sp. NBC_00102 TaxID=2975652 RepID=UPI0022560F3F|nr:hypothetical protein [Streptomyces sp. NBC_00102]MCX5398000.1 hypothetical protein [Streptomyces sp. NBC_00102]